MKVAFATSNGISIDQNFRKARSFTIWHIRSDEAYYVNCVSIREDADDDDGKNVIRVNALQGCTIVCAREICGPSAARLVSGRIHPIRNRSIITVETMIGRLQAVLRTTPAPWIRKAIARDMPFYNDEYNLLNVTVADLLVRHPKTHHLLLGGGVAPFSNEEAISEGGVLLTLKEALEQRGISEDLFVSLLRTTRITSDYLQKSPGRSVGLLARANHSA